MKAVHKIIDQVIDEENGKREAHRALHQSTNEALHWLFDQLNDDVVKTQFNRPHVDHLRNGLDFVVVRAGKTVCTVEKDSLSGKGKLKSGDELGSEAHWVDDKQHTLLRIVRMLEAHRQKFPVDETATAG